MTDRPRRPVVDLLLPLGEVVRRLEPASSAGDALDAFVLSAAAVQILEDHLHRDLFWLHRATSYLRDLPGAAVPAVASKRAARIAFALDERNPAQQRWVDVLDILRGARDAWAEVVMGVLPIERAVTDPAALSAALRDLASAPRSMRRQVLRLPSSFRSFDQHPRDLDALAELLRPRLDAEVPVLVLGLRTSGSYLAPLLAAALKTERPGEVGVLTVRPGYPLHRAERARLRSVAVNGGMVVVVDDPPTTGGSMVKAMVAAEAEGVPRHHVIPAIGCFVRADGSVIVPEALTPWDPVVLPYDRWDIHARLRPERLAEAVRSLTGIEVRLEPAGELVTRPREHVRAVFASVDDPSRGVLAEAAGLGLFADHAGEVARRLSGLVPEPIGVHDGVLLSWIDLPMQPVTPSPVEVAAYAGARRRELGALADQSSSMTGRQAVWEVAANIVSNGSSRLGPFLRKPALDHAVRTVLHVDAPTVIDGRAGEGWVGTPAGVRKVEFAEGAFSHRDLWCYDATFDVVPFTAVAGPAAAERQRDAWEAELGAALSPERWMLLELVHLWDLRRQGRLDRATLRRHQSRVVHRAFARRYVDPSSTNSGDVVALDLDGVLETTVAGFASPTVAGATAVRLLGAHGYRPVVCTGRSLGEVVDRCELYGLAGGVAEYGSVVHLAGSAEPLVLVAEEDRAELDRLREHLVATGWRLDDGFSYCVRAWRSDAGGLRGGTPEENAAAVEGFGRIVAVPGIGQTDFVGRSVDKGRGIDVLLERLGGSLAMAIGDTESDRPMLSRAAVGRIPANAAASLDPSFARTHGAYQEGVLEAVQELVGHPAAVCDQCRPPAIDPAAAQVHAMLSVFAGGARNAPVNTLRLLARRPA